MAKKLTKSKNKIVGGVCAGIAEYVDIDPTIVRLLWVLITLISGVVMGIIVYIVFWIVMPER